MGKGNFTEDFKLGAIKQITECSYSVANVSKRLGVSTHSLSDWKGRFSIASGGIAKDNQSAEIRQLKQELARVTEGRDILKKPPRTSLRMESEARVCNRASPGIFDPCNVLDAFDHPNGLLCVAETAIQQALC